MNKGQGQILSMLEGIYGRIWHLGRKRKLRKCQRGNRRIQERISVENKENKSIRKRRRNI